LNTAVLPPDNGIAHNGFTRSTVEEKYSRKCDANQAGASKPLHRTQNPVGKKGDVLEESYHKDAGRWMSKIANY